MVAIALYYWRLGKLSFYVHGNTLSGKARACQVDEVRSGQERSGAAQFGGIGDRVAERLPWLHDQAGACAGGRVAVKGVIHATFSRAKGVLDVTFPGRKGVLHATFSNRKGVLGGAQPGPG